MHDRAVCYDVLIIFLLISTFDDRKARKKKNTPLGTRIGDR